jgi:hypothetical protein
VGGINCKCQLWSRIFPPIKAQGEPKVVTPKFQNTLNFSTYQQTKTCYIKTQIYKSNALIPGRQFWLLKLQMLEWVSWQRSVYQSTNQMRFFLVYPDDALHNLKSWRALKKHNTCLCRHITLLTKHVAFFPVIPVECLESAFWVSWEFF